MMHFQWERSAFWAAGLVRIICRIVGTQCEKVTFSVWISLRIMPGSYMPG